VELKLNGTHLLLDYADDVNLQGANIDNIKNNTGRVGGLSKINERKTNCSLLSCHQPQVKFVM
jgi:hypothetical protein